MYLGCTCVLVFSFSSLRSSVTTSLYPCEPTYLIHLLQKTKDTNDNWLLNKIQVMMRVGDQAKLLFLYLLRSSSALATRATTSTATTTSTTTSSTSNTVPSVSGILPKTTSTTARAKSIPSSSSSSSSIQSESDSLLQGHINLRLATRLDVPSIQRCNLATLPENYSSNFYVNHIRSFPELALVAEHIPPGINGSGCDAGGMNMNNNNNKYRRNPFDNYNPSPAASETQIIGYVLGKMEHTEPTMTSTNHELPSLFPPSHPQLLKQQQQQQQQQRFVPSRITTGNQELDEFLTYKYQEQEELFNQQPPPEILGHVTSLAVLKPFRRKGLAALLMKQLHFHMRHGYHATGVGLHVRVSNIAARRLYCEGMGYGVVDVIRGYYADGEDAFFMKKDLTLLDEEYNLMEESLNGIDSFMDMQQQRRNPIGSRWNLRRRMNNNNSDVNRSAMYLNGPLEFRLPMMIPLNEENSSEEMNNNVPELVDDSSEEEDSRVMTGSL